MHLAKRIASLPPYLFAEVNKRIAAKRAQGVDVINLGIGDPDLPPPAHIVEAVQKGAAEPAAHRYPNYYGLPELKEAFARWFAGRFGVKLDPQSEVTPLAGTKEGLIHLPWALVDPGDVVLLPDPGYPPYNTGTLLAGGEPYAIPLLAEKGWQPDLRAIPADVAARARLLILCYPNNPTGATLPDLALFEEAVAFARQHDLVVVHDAAYSEVYYDGYLPPSFLQVPGAREVGVEFHSLSKTYSMAGWRLGFMVGNAQLVKALADLKTNIDSGVPTAIQVMGIAALNGDQSWIPARNAIYARRRDIVCDGLAAVGLRALRPKASLYIWGQVPQGYSSPGFSLKVIDEAGVFLIPGDSYGQNGEGYFRISLTVPDDRLAEAMRRLKGLKL